MYCKTNGLVRATKRFGTNTDKVNPHSHQNATTIEVSMVKYINTFREPTGKKTHHINIITTHSMPVPAKADIKHCNPRATK